MYDVNATFSAEQSKIEGSHPIHMVVVNASRTGWSPMYYADINQSIYGFVMQASGELDSTATLYTALPIDGGSIKTTLDAQVSEVTVSIPNVNRAIESLIQTKKYFRGHDVYFVTSFAESLPSGSTAYHIGDTEDHNAAIIDKFYINSTSSNDQAVTFSCKTKFDIKNVAIPRRTYTRTCFWAENYLGTECDPNASINSASLPTCDGTLEECRERHNQKRFGGFPGIPLSRHLMI
jgi:lambda family phage minor tail protein L